MLYLFDLWEPYDRRSSQDVNVNTKMDCSRISSFSNNCVHFSLQMEALAKKSEHYDLQRRVFGESLRYLTRSRKKLI